MLYQFVLLPLMGLVALVFGFLIVRAARRTPSRSVADPAWRVPAIVGGWAAAVFGAWVLVPLAAAAVGFVLTRWS